ncbi:restriction endonuclease subunit S [Alkalinema pantanalense CENA528]|uniref:restriction endonuclease subunit S n=1 Tax=Alkalinema pantanalense TaxID=1620705 RepID=UPI003D6FC33D
MSEWKDTTLGNVIELKRGYDLPQQRRRNGSFPIVSSSGITDFHCEPMVKSPGVVTGRYGTLGEVYYITDDFWPLNTTLYVKDFKGNHPRFIAYFLKSLDFSAYSDKAAVPGLNRNHLHTAQIKFPPTLYEQKAIASILSSLDNKIELNRRMNETLEAMARAIFKDWFVDFGPTRAKQEGRAAYLPESLWSLFPDAIDEETDLPEGWEIKKLGDFIEIKHGYAFKGEFFRTEPPGDILLTPGNFAIGGGFKADKFKYYLGEIPDDYILEHNDLLITMTDLSKAGDTLGYPALIPKASKYKYLHNQRLGKVIFLPQSLISKMYLYYLLKTDSYRCEVLASASGTSVKHTSPKKVQAYSFPCPPHTLLQKFEEYVASFQEFLDTNSQQNLILSETRDRLLPKLMSGEIRVKDAEKIIEKI